MAFTYDSGKLCAIVADWALLTIELAIFEFLVSSLASRLALAAIDGSELCF